MSKEDFLIKAEGLTKTYRLYDKPSARLFSLFRREKSEQELDPARVHHALRGIDITIKRGEKVGIIGRNGAGKSTLLKLITGVIDATGGSLDVRGQSHALLSLGAGFHPEFTGRENAYAFLAHMGFSGNKADDLVDDAIAFAEIEEYIDQPLKTYSTGMQARLMFAVSTALEPELLVIDEVLGVGDAYFQHKSFDRIRELCDANDTTLLLVSHDIYSAVKLVDRLVWIDRGRIVSDGEPSEVLKAYENSIRLQEDARQKQKLALAFRRQVKNRKAMLPAFIEIRARGNEPAKSPVYIQSMSLSWHDGRPNSLPIFQRDHGIAALGDGYSIQLLPHVPWGDVVEIDGQTTRAWNNFGAVDHKVGLVIYPHSQKQSDQLINATLSITTRTNDTVDADIVYIQPDGRESVLHRLLTKAGEWETVSVGLDDVESNAPVTTASFTEADGETGRQGSGRIVFTSFELLNHRGEEGFNLEHGRQARFRIGYHVNDPSLNEKCQVILALRRNGVDDVARSICRDLEFSALRSSHGVIQAEFPNFPIAVGTYTLTVLIAREGYYENNTGQFYAINPDVYDSRRDIFKFEVTDQESIASHGTGVMLEAAWTQTDG